MSQLTLRPALARVAAHLILAHDGVGLNPAGDHPVLRFSILQALPDLLDNLAKLVINALMPVGNFTIEPLRARDIMLVHHVLDHMDRAQTVKASSPHIPLTWENTDLKGRMGFAIINTVPAPCYLGLLRGQRMATLTTWSDILAVMDLNGMGTPALRRVLRALIRMSCNQIGPQGLCARYAEGGEFEPESFIRHNKSAAEDA